MTEITPPEAPPASHFRTQLLTRAEASAALALYGIQMKPATLARAWSTGRGGPPLQHIRGKPWYPRDRLEAWALSQITEPACSARERDLHKQEARRNGRS